MFQIISSTNANKIEIWLLFWLFLPIIWSQVWFFFFSCSLTFVSNLKSKLIINNIYYNIGKLFTVRILLSFCSHNAKLDSNQFTQLVQLIIEILSKCQSSWEMRVRNPFVPRQTGRMADPEAFLWEEAPASGPPGCLEAPVRWSAPSPTPTDLNQEGESDRRTFILKYTLLT